MDGPENEWQGAAEGLVVGAVVVGLREAMALVGVHPAGVTARGRGLSAVTVTIAGLPLAQAALLAQAVMESGVRDGS